MPNPHHEGGKLGIRADIGKTGASKLPAFKKAFSETGGFVVEVSDEKGFKKICERYNIKPIHLGEATPDPAFEIRNNGNPLVIQFLDNIREAWMGSLAKKLK